METFVAAATGVWFAIFVLGFLFMGIFSSEMDNIFLGMLTLAAGIVGLDLLFGYPMWEAIVANPLVILLYVAIYIIVGSIYVALWKWPEWLRERKSAILSAYNKYLKESNRKTGQKYEDAILEDTDEIYDNFLNDNYYYRDWMASNNKLKLSNWTMLWPFDLFWELIRKPIRWLSKNIYKALGKTYEKIGQRTARNIRKSR